MKDTEKATQRGVQAHLKSSCCMTQGRPAMAAAG